MKAKKTAPMLQNLLLYFSEDYRSQKQISKAIMDAMEPLFQEVSDLRPSEENNEFKSIWIMLPRGDVISCAAPNLRRKPGTIHNPEYGNPVEVTADELYRLHTKRAEHILHIAAVNAADALVLGAFGCGAFANDPEVVARAYNDVLKDYKKNFKLIEFAVYCRPSETENYDAFKCNIR